MVCIGLEEETEAAASRSHIAFAVASVGNAT